jgi:ATP/maltotriose-dependent transcriptional regulator MalT/DNA-binding SARP family transcriptional activator
MGTKKNSASLTVPIVAANRPSARLAKLTLPKLPTAIPRERLFALLDERLSEHLLVWIHGPPGAGKTTLAGTFLAHSSRVALWYRVDAGDTDLPTFFSHLREAALNVHRAASALPALSPEYLLDVQTFACNFFRSLFGLFDSPAALLLDNYQDAGEGILDAVILAAVAELPNHINIVVLSRSAPPAALATLQLRNGLATIEWHTLRLTLDEAMAIAFKSQVTDTAMVRDLYSSCDGWAAGLVLLLEYTKRLGAPEAHAAAPARETLFSYFSNELFTTVPSGTQRLLMCTAMLPNFTLAQAAAFATKTEAEQAVDWLQKRNFFIDYREGAQRTYRYHALFREFLLERGKSFFSAPERQELLVMSAELFESSGQTEIALTLAIEARAWHRASGLLCKLAPGLLHQGRMSTLERSIYALPAAYLDEIPWIRYWLGFAKMPFDPTQGRQQLELAYEGFERAGDLLGRLMACSAILHGFFVEWADQRGSDRWIGILGELTSRADIPRSMEVETAIVSALPGLLLRNLNHPLAAPLAERACIAFRQTDNMEQRVSIGTVAIWYFGMAGPVARCQQIFEEINATIKVDQLSPLLLLQWSMLEIFHSHVSFRIADYEARAAKLERVIEMTHLTGIRVLDATIAGQCMYLTLKANDLPRAQHYLGEIAAALSAQRPLDTSQFLWHQAAVAVLRGDFQSAHASILECFRSAQALGCDFGSAQAQILLVYTWMRLNRRDDAKREADALVKAARGLQSQPLEYAALLMRSYVLLDGGEQSAGLAALSHALSYGAATAQMTPSPWVDRRIVQELCETALLQDIEPGQVRNTIVSLGLRPRNLDLESWPWPIRIFTLGRFSVLRGDRPMSFSSKAQKKPLELLRMLIALGGRSVNIDTIMTAMWPQEGAAARASLDVTLMRLRKLLGHPDVLVLSDGKLTLNDQVCWVDCWTFERAVAGLDAGADAHLIAKVSSLYRGAFLAREHNIACVVNARDRLAAKFQRLVLRAGKQQERAQDWEAAAHVYRRGLEQDNTHEEFYRRLMTCQFQLGERVEAIKTYKRCRDLLSINLQARPSAETETLYRRLTGE